MIYENAVDEVKEQRQIEPQMIALAKVTSLTDGKALVQFYGESTPSTKAYPYIEGYKPTVNDIVCMIAQGNTYIIVGKVTNDNITTNYDVERSELNTILAAYLTQSSAASTYLTKSSAASTYLSQSSAEDTYLTQSSASSTYLSKTSAANTYRGINTPFSSIVNGSRSLEMTSGGDVLPDSNLVTDLGNSLKMFGNLWASTINTEDIYTDGGYALLRLSQGLVRPKNNQGVSLGSYSYKYLNIYAVDIYGTVADPSDKRLKKSIKTLGRKWLDFFYKLRPTSFKYRDGTSDRTHTGFIAQEVEQAAHDVGIETKDIAAVVIDDDGTYGIRYSELISVLTLAIQDLNKRVEELERGTKK